MKVTLVLNGEKRVYYSRGITAGASLTAYDLFSEIADSTGSADSMAKLYGPEHRERLLRFVVELFGGQFTEQEFLDGYQDSFFAAVPDMLRTVIAGVSTKVASFPKEESPEAGA